MPTTADHAFSAGDIVARRCDGRRGIVRGLDAATATYVVFWFALRVAGGSWRASDLILIRDAAADLVIRRNGEIARAASARRSEIARVREAAGLPDWHSDEVDVEITRVRACATVEAYRAVSREGSPTPLGARQKIAIWRVIGS